MPAWLQTSLDITVLVFMAISLLGLAMPIFPGLVVIWGLAFLHGLATGFGMGWGVFIVLTVLMVIGSLVDNIFMGAKARQGGAGWLSIGLALLSGLVISVLLTPLIGLLAAPLALLLAEYARQRDWEPAWQATRALLTGWGWAFVARFLIGLVMIVLWSWKVF
jgi:uncharacterized protein YqgC (DUF456 family)